MNITISCLRFIRGPEMQTKLSPVQNNISTRRLLLTLLTEDDYEFIIELVNSSGWIKFIGNRNIHSKEEALAYINKIVRSGNIFYWVVRKKEGNIPIGIISFLKRSYLDHFDIGFAFLPPFTGYGYAYEAAKEVLSVVRSIPGYNCILATTIPGNAKSIELLTRLGLYFERELETDGEKLLVYSTSAKKD